MINKNINCIIPTYNVGRYLSDAINSVINQDIGFENINLVIVNDGSTDNTDEIIKAYQSFYPDILCIKQENKGVSAARNAGLDFCMENSAAPFTCFLDGDDKYDISHMRKLVSFLNKHGASEEIAEELERENTDFPDVVFLPIKMFERHTGLHHAYKVIDRGETRVIDMKTENVFFSHVSAALFRTSSLIDVRFNESLSISEDADFVLKVLEKTNQAGWYNEKTNYLLRMRADESSVMDKADTNPALYERISFYRAEYENYIETLGSVPRLVQASRLYDIHWLKQNNNDPQKHGIEIDVDQAIEDIRFIIQNTDEDLLEQKYIPYWYRAYFKQMKYGDIYLKKYPIHIHPLFLIKEEIFESLSGNIEIRFIKQLNHTIKIRGFFVKSSYDYINFVCKFNNKTIKAKISPSYQNDRKYFLGKEIFPTMDFEFSIDIRNLRPEIKYSLEFYFTYQDVFSAAHMVHSWFSRFYYKNTFFIGDNAIVRKSWSSHALEVQKLSKASINTQVLSRKDFYKDPYLFHQYVENYDTFRNKRIWLFIDRPTSIGDNAEALFRYCCNINDGIEKFMVIPDASYYPNFEGVNPRIIIFGSFEFKMLLMFAEKVISSTTFYEYIDIDTNIPKSEFKKITSALSNVQEVFLQHGILQNYGIVDEYLNSAMRDLDLMVTSAKKEYELMLRPETGYTKDIIKLTGMPRFDLLKNNPEKIVSFLPTWRKRYSKRDGSYNSTFKQTDLYHSINELINDSRLLAALKEKGYRFILKLHPKLHIQMDDFQIPDGVEMVGNEITYNELCEKSSLYITDFSSAVFDFAYLKKPVLYYQAVKLDYEQSEDVFSYEHDGFGDVTTGHMQAVEKVIEYLQKDCEMESKYQQRVDKFFVFRDQKNSQRVYKEIMKLPKRVRDQMV